MADRHAVVEGAEPWSAPGHGANARTGVLLVHGFTGCPASLRPLAEALVERGFAVELPRLPGHGTSWRDMMKTGYADWRAEVESALSRLRSRSDKIVLVGLSMGGTLVLDVASRGADVAGVVAINALVLNRDDIVSKLAPLLEKLLPVVPSTAAGLIPNDIAKPGMDEKAYSWLPAAAGNSLLRELPRIRSQLAALRVPLLVAFSSQDHSVDPANSRAILRMAGTEDVTELVLERSYHVATLDYDFDVLLEKIAAFAERVSAPRRP